MKAIVLIWAVFLVWLGISKCAGPSDSLRENADYRSGYTTGVMFSNAADWKSRCEQEAIHRYAMRGDDPEAKVGFERFKIGCEDGVKGE